MSLQETLTPIFRGWGSEINSLERANLKDKAMKDNLSSWRNKHIALVTTAGGAAGITGGPWSSCAAIGADLWVCRKVAPIACLGMGYILGHDVDFEQDMNLIMAIWSGIGTASATVPAGKVGVKVSPKMTMKVGTKFLPKLAAKGSGKIAGKVVGKVISKTALKGTSQIAGVLTSKVVSKAVGKVSAKMAAKVGVGWIPIIGGVVSGGINWWLLETLMDAAHQYYSNPYVVFDSSELEI